MNDPHPSPRPRARRHPPEPRVRQRPRTSRLRVAGAVDALSRSFARELARVLADADKALKPVLREALAGSRTARITAGRGVALRQGEPE